MKRQFIACSLIAICMIALMTSPAVAGYPDGMNRYAAYHVMHSGIDPTGEQMEHILVPPFHLPAPPVWRYKADMGTFSGKLGPYANKPNDATWAGSDFSLRFMADQTKFRKKDCCDEVRFVQIVNIGSNAKSKPLHGAWGLTQGKWVWDARGTYYPYGSWKHPMITTGSHMTDTPFLKQFRWFGENVDFYGFEAESCAVCSKGNWEGEIYGCVKWGHSFNWYPNKKGIPGLTPQSFFKDWSRFVTGAGVVRSDHTKTGRANNPQSNGPHSTIDFNNLEPREPSSIMMSMIAHYIP